MVNDLRQLAVAGPLVEVNEVGCDAHGPFLVQRQCDEFGSVLTVRSSDIYCATATSYLRRMNRRLSKEESGTDQRQTDSLEPVGLVDQISER